MRRWLIAMASLALMVPFAGSFASARPMDGATQQQLLGLYSRYNQAVAAGHLDQALALRTEAVRAALTQQFKTPKDRQDYLANASQMVPERVELRHASISDAGDKALLIVWADKSAGAGPVQSELDLSFVREGGGWRIGDLAIGPGPADIKRCRDPSFQPISAYDTSHSVALVGRIERVDFLPDHTLAVVLAGDTETCAFLPTQAALQQHGLDPATLQPYRFVEISGVAARGDAQKVMVNNITVHAEE
jgi:hypothetical protein